MTTAETRQQRRFRARQEKKGIAKPQKNAYKRALEQFKIRAEAMKAAAIMTPLLAKIALMDLAARMGVYKSRGHGRGTPSRNYMRPYCNNGGTGRPHQGVQECLRRAVGGFAMCLQREGMNKREAVAVVKGRLQSLRDLRFA